MRYLMHYQVLLWQRHSAASAIGWSIPGHRVQTYRDGYLSRFYYYINKRIPRHERVARPVGRYSPEIRGRTAIATAGPAAYLVLQSRIPSIKILLVYTYIKKKLVYRSLTCPQDCQHCIELQLVVAVALGQNRSNSSPTRRENAKATNWSW